MENNKVYLSKEMREALINNIPQDKNKIHVGGYEIPVHESPIFPFEIHYDACDVETRSLIKIGSGEFVHGAMIPQVKLEVEPPSFELSFDEHKGNLRGFAERNWGMQIFKF